MFSNKNVNTQSYFTSASYSVGLRNHFASVYSYMSSALAITGLVAFAASKSMTLMQLFYSNPMMMLIFAFLPIGLSIYMVSKVQTMSLSGLSTCLMIYSGMIGLSLAPIFLIYTHVSIAKTFFISASVFGIMSIYGYTTKKDLASMGSFAIMGVIGVFIASLVNLFFKSSGLDFVISIIGLGCFIVLAAWDTQKIKNIYLSAGSAAQESDMMKKLGVLSALSLYLDFINIFMFLLRFMGERRND
jgi:FtsH-binding integral membrane protein